MSAEPSFANLIYPKLRQKTTIDKALRAVYNGGRLSVITCRLILYMNSLIFGGIFHGL